MLAGHTETMEEEIVQFFIKERTYVCPQCLGQLITSFDETDLMCPTGCGVRMVEAGDEPETVCVACKECGYLSWIPLSDSMVCDTCGAPVEKWMTRADLRKK